MSGSVIEPVTFATAPIFNVVVPLGLMAVATRAGVVALPSTFNRNLPPVRFKVVSGAVGVPAVPVTIRLPSFTVTVLAAPFVPAAMLAA